ncbi:MAG: bifunctional salicylyl-CoA 5-hydroxylase/oxidoreductase [Myxococcota bacterium]|nr:bifunctional salicylyl-CoA 5-hydroxylase/oxidoreductase [Myxococcota bacterium]
MKIVTVGGGPAGLYFGILMKKAFPHTELSVLERNRADDTFGWGVVFSEETLGNLQEADPESFEQIRARFAYWDDIETWYRGTRSVSKGHGFCGLSRRELLRILQERARALGVRLEFQREVPSLGALPPADLIIAADGVNSALRNERAAAFGPTVVPRWAKFCWLGTALPLRAFTFLFKETPHGVFQVHAYPFQDGLSTFIVECHQDVWVRAGLDRMSEPESVAFLEKLFADELQGHPLLTNRSQWRTFPTIRCDRWSDGNVVLMGDAAHTAHFSIGSGTKLALEDAIALVAAFQKHGTGDLPTVLRSYEEARKPEVLRLQRAAQTSLEWFENSGRYVGQPAWQFTFNLMTRSKRITYDNLRERDPALIQEVDRAYAEQQGTRLNSDGTAPPPMFAPLRLRGMTLANRIVVSPMCQYVARDGLVDEWHLVHLGSRAMGGAGLVITEMTDVSQDGRITPGCAGMWTDAHEAAWKRIVDFIHARSTAKVAIQLAHAGRKGSCSAPWEGDRPLETGGWQTLAPSALPYGPQWPTPREMDADDLRRVKEAFVAAAVRSARAGFDMIELHLAHGYLLSSFLSPLSNRRTDAYGGSLENRARFPLEVFDAVRAAWPQDRPLGVRVSATDWLEPEGMTVEDTVALARMLQAHGCDLVDVSTAGNVPESRPEYGRMYQVPFAEAVRHRTGLPVMAVGNIQGWDHANTILAAGRADLCAMARPHLADPYLTHRAAQHYGADTVDWPQPYLLVRPRR